MTYRSVHLWSCEIIIYLLEHCSITVSVCVNTETGPGHARLKRRLFQLRKFPHFVVMIPKQACSDMS